MRLVLYEYIVSGVKWLFPIKCVLIFVQVDEPLNLASQQQNQAIASYLNVHLKNIGKNHTNDRNP